MTSTPVVDVMRKLEQKLREFALTLVVSDACKEEMIRGTMEKWTVALVKKHYPPPPPEKKKIPRLRLTHSPYFVFCPTHYCAPSCEDSITPNTLLDGE